MSALFDAVIRGSIANRYVVLVGALALGLAGAGLRTLRRRRERERRV